MIIYEIYDIYMRFIQVPLFLKIKYFYKNLSYIFKIHTKKR